jgi:hypothetical protein
MLRRVPRVLLIGIGLAIAAGGPAPRGTAQESGPGGAQAPQLAPKDEAALALHDAYNNLTLVSVWLSSKRAKLSEDESQLAGRADEFYRSAHQSYQGRDYARSTALALAAVDASRGLQSVLHASTPPVAGLPAPPELTALPAARPGPERAPGAGLVVKKPQEAARELLNAVRGQILAAEKEKPAPAAKPFLDASRKVYERALQAYKKGEYTTALDLAVGAEAWASIGNHLKQAGGGDRPPPARP